MGGLKCQECLVIAKIKKVLFSSKRSKYNRNWPITDFFLSLKKKFSQSNAGFKKLDDKGNNSNHPSNIKILLNTGVAKPGLHKGQYFS